MEVARRLKADPELQPLIEEDEDGLSYLNAAGELLFRVARALGPRAVWPPAAALPPAEKCGLSGVPHHRPKGWKTFVERLCNVDCVSRVIFDGSASGGKTKVLYASTGAIGVCFGSQDCALPLRVETTARGGRQTELVVDYITNKVLRR